MKLAYVVFLSLCLLGCNPVVDVQLPASNASAPVLTDMLVRIREDGHVQTEQGAVPMADAIKGLGASESTRVLIKPCSRRVDMSKIADALGLLKLAGYGHVELKDAPAESACPGP